MNFEDKAGRKPSAVPAATGDPDKLCLPKVKRPVVVELGSAGLSWKGESEAELLLRSAKRHPDWLHLGIDISDLSNPVLSNVIHRKADFIGGLRSLEDDSAAMIVSRFAVGYYSPTGRQIPLASVPASPDGKFISEHDRMRPEVVDYTSGIIDVSCSKLRPEGIIYIQACKFITPLVLEAVGKCKLVKKSVVSEFAGIADNSGLSYWGKSLAERGPIYLVKIRRY